jgi:hypothetical protein
VTGVTVPNSQSMTGLLIRDGDGVRLTLECRLGYRYEFTGTRTEGGYAMTGGLVFIPDCWVIEGFDPLLNEVVSNER